MRSEPQDMALAVDVQTPKLPCLTGFIYLMFELDVVERVKSGQISLVVTCTTPPWVRSIPFGKRTLIHTRQIALCEPKSQTISNMRRSSY